MVQITNKNNGEVICEGATLQKAVNAAPRDSLNRRDLSWADLRGADLRYLDSREGGFTSSNLTGADLTGALLPPGVPVVEQLDERILQLVESGAGRLDMRHWHTCGTAHCLAGWAIHLAGEAGQQLEDLYGPAVAGSFIYWKSTGRIPDFYCDSAEALESLRVHAQRAERARTDAIVGALRGVDWWVRVSRYR